jgi:hypothetical protein
MFTKAGWMGAATVLTLNSCATVPVVAPEASQWDDSAQILTITVHSEPEGATFFGMVGVVPGRRIGVTPITISYTATGTFPNLRYWCRNCGGGVSPFAALLITRQSSVMQTCSAVFRGVVRADGYRPYYFNQAVHRERELSVFSSGKNCWDDLVGRHLEFTAVLERDPLAGQRHLQR